jgi:hypothetical protein
VSVLSSIIVCMFPRVLRDRGGGSKLLVDISDRKLVNLLRRKLIVERCFAGVGRGGGRGTKVCPFCRLSCSLPRFVL